MPIPRATAQTEGRKSPLQQARQFYSSAFEHDNSDDLASGIDEFVTLGSGEQLFVLGHLLFLNLKAHAHVNRTLRSVGGAVQDGVEGVDNMIEVLDELSDQARSFRAAIRDGLKAGDGDQDDWEEGLDGDEDDEDLYPTAGRAIPEASSSQEGEASEPPRGTQEPGDPASKEG